MRRLAFLLLPVLTLAQDTEELGDDDPEVRRRAQEAFERLGVRARPMLQQAAESGDPEVRARALQLLDRINRVRAEQEQAAIQRAKKLTPGSARAGRVDGACFEFEVQPWKPQGRILGYVFTTRCTREFIGQLEWDVVVRNSGEIPVQRCGRHSPQKVFVADPDLSRARVTVFGIRRWYCEFIQELRLPADGEQRRVGDFVIELRWPNLLVRTDEPVDRVVLESTLSSGDIRLKVKEGRGRKRRVLRARAGG